MFGRIKQWTDKWDVDGEVKCKDQTGLSYEWFVVTSNFSIESVFRTAFPSQDPATEEYQTALQSLLRRFQVIYFDQNSHFHICERCNPVNTPEAFAQQFNNKQSSKQVHHKVSHSVYNSKTAIAKTNRDIEWKQQAQLTLEEKKQDDNDKEMT